MTSEFWMDLARFKKTVKTWADHMKEQYPEEKNIDQKLAMAFFVGIGAEVHFDTEGEGYD